MDFINHREMAAVSGADAKGRNLRTTMMLHAHEHGGHVARAKLMDDAAAMHPPGSHQHTFLTDAAKQARKLAHQADVAHSKAASRYYKHVAGKPPRAPGVRGAVQGIARTFRRFH